MHMPWRMLAVVAGLLLAAACARPDPEQRLRAALGALQQGIEARDVDAIDAVLADDFIGPDAMDATQARRMAQLTFMRYRDVGVALGPADVDIDGDRATVTLTAVLGGGSGALLPERANAYSVRSGWRLEGRDWRLSSVEWTPVR